jgi:hypothetical protein
MGRREREAIQSMRGQTRTLPILRQPHVATGWLRGARGYLAGAEGIAGDEEGGRAVDMEHA